MVLYINFNLNTCIACSCVRDNKEFSSIYVSFSQWPLRGTELSPWRELLMQTLKQVMQASLFLGSITSHCFGKWASAHSLDHGWTREVRHCNLRQSETRRHKSSRYKLYFLAQIVAAKVFFDPACSSFTVGNIQDFDNGKSLILPCSWRQGQNTALKSISMAIYPQNSLM